MDLLSDLVDEELELTKQKDIRRHLMTCHDCETFFHTFRRTVSLMHEMEMMSVPLLIHNRLWSLIHDEETKHQSNIPINNKQKKVSRKALVTNESVTITIPVRQIRKTVIEGTFSAVPKKKRR
jgi:hypothetical protein